MTAQTLCDISPQGPKDNFLRTSAHIAIYGGAAGGGKTFALLMEALRYRNVRGFGAVIFAKAGKNAGISFKVTPHVLRASAVTYLKQQGFQDSDIMRVTGHATSEMVFAYNKSARSDNASKKVNLIS